YEEHPLSGNGGGRQRTGQDRRGTVSHLILLEREGGRGRDDRDSRQDVLHREIVQLAGSARGYVLRDDDLVAAFPRVACRRFDAEVGGDPAEDDGPHTASAELKVQFGAVERPP